MAKTKFFRVAVEGDTIDGRKIERQHIQQISDSYATDTYTARINCEHMRSYSPEAPFNAYGSVAEVKAEEFTLKLGGKDETRLALYASFEVNDQAKALTKADQKVFPSIEINPNFANSGKAYLVGLALTDSPASLGTQILKFSKRDTDKDNLIALDDPFTVDFEEDAPENEANGAFKAMRDFFSSLAAPKTPAEPEANPAPKAPEGNEVMAEFSAKMTECVGKLVNIVSANMTQTDTAIAKLRQDFTALQSEIEAAPSQSYRARPTGSGGGDIIRADC